MDLQKDLIQHTFDIPNKACKWGGNDLFHQKAKLSFFMIRRQNSKVAVRSYESVWSDGGSNGAVCFQFPVDGHIFPPCYKPKPSP